MENFLPVCIECDSLFSKDGQIYTDNCLVSSKQKNIKTCFGNCIYVIHKTLHNMTLFRRGCHVDQKTTTNKYGIQYKRGVWMYSICKARISITCNDEIKFKNDFYVYAKDISLTTNQNTKRTSLCLSCYSTLKLEDYIDNDNCLKGIPTTMFNMISCETKCIIHLFKDIEKTQIVRGCENSNNMYYYDVNNIKITIPNKENKLNLNCEVCNDLFSPTKDIPISFHTELEVNNVEGCKVKCVLMGLESCYTFVYDNERRLCRFSKHSASRNTPNMTSGNLVVFKINLKVLESGCRLDCFISCKPKEYLCNDINYKSVYNRLLYGDLEDEIDSDNNSTFIKYEILKYVVEQQKYKLNKRQHRIKFMKRGDYLFPDDLFSKPKYYQSIDRSLNIVDVDYINEDVDDYSNDFIPYSENTLRDYVPVKKDFTELMNDLEIQVNKKRQREIDDNDSIGSLDSIFDETKKIYTDKELEWMVHENVNEKEIFITKDLSIKRYPAFNTKRKSVFTIISNKLNPIKRRKLRKAKKAEKKLMSVNELSLESSLDRTQNKMQESYTKKPPEIYTKIPLIIHPETPLKKYEEEHIYMSLDKFQKIKSSRKGKMAMAYKKLTTIINTKPRLIYNKHVKFWKHMVKQHKFRKVAAGSLIGATIISTIAGGVALKMYDFDDDSQNDVIDQQYETGINIVEVNKTIDEQSINSTTITHSDNVTTIVNKTMDEQNRNNLTLTHTDNSMTIETQSTTSLPNEPTIQISNQVYSSIKIKKEKDKNNFIKRYLNVAEENYYLIIVAISVMIILVFVMLYIFVKKILNHVRKKRKPVQHSTYQYSASE